MADRLDKMERIRRLQGDLHRIAEWRHAQLAQRERALHERQAALIETLNDGDRLHGLFVAAMARRLKALSGESERVGAMREAQAGRVLVEAKRLKRAELMADRLELDRRRETEKRDLMEMIEALLARRGDASLP